MPPKTATKPQPELVQQDPAPETLAEPEIVPVIEQEPQQPADNQLPQPELAKHAWSDVDATARALEKQQGQYGARVTLITTTADVPPEGLWHGVYGNATVIAGETTIISLSDGRKFDAAGDEIAAQPE